MTDRTVDHHLIFMTTAMSILPLSPVLPFRRRRPVRGITRTGVKG
jgi:multiple sugar transport system permease protein